MKAYTMLIGLLLSGITTMGCSKNEVPEPAAPKPPTLDADEMMDEPVDKPLSSGFIIKASEIGVEVFIDGKSRGVTEEGKPIDIEVAPGVHQVMFVFPSGEKMTQEETLNEGDWFQLYMPTSPNSSDAIMNGKKP